MEYRIKNFENDGDKKFVGFYITDEQGQILAIDKRVPLETGKTDAEYVQDALALCADEITKWQASISVVGKTFNPETGEFV